MRILSSTIFAVAILVGCAVCAAAQDRKASQPALAAQASAEADDGDYNSLVKSVFAPYTEQLNLTKEQQFRVVAIISGAEAQMSPLEQQLSEISDELDGAEVSEHFDESKVRELSVKEAGLLADLITIKADARARLFQILTPGQKALVMRSGQVGGRAEADGPSAY